MHDLESRVKELHVIGPATIGANATKDGKVIDRLGFGGVRFVIGYGAVTTTGSVLTLVIREGDTTGSLTSVADADLIGTEATASLPATTPRTSGVSQNVRKSIGYKGGKRYVTARIVQTGTSSAGGVDVTAELFNPESTSGAGI